MKLLHTADWHIGRTLNGYSLLEEQDHAFQQIIRIAKEEKVEGIVIAGDLYDRALPPVEAVKAFDQMIKTILTELEIPIYAISGNHDGAKRLNFGTSLFSQSHFYLTTQLQESLEPIETETTQIYLLPYFEPIDAYLLFKDEEQELRHIGQAIERVVEEMKKTFHPDKQQVLVTHFAVTKRGEQEEEWRQQLTSETTSTVGGLKTVTTDLFDDFDAVLLGHIHTRHASPTDTVFYSGSPVMFNTKEAKLKQDKGVYIVDISEDGLEKHFKALTPKTPIMVLEETYETLISPDFYEQQPRKEAWFAFKVMDFDRQQLEGINIRAQLEEIYGDKIVELLFDFRYQGDLSRLDKEESIEQMAPETVIANFYQTVSGEDLSDRQLALVEELLTEIKKEK